MVLQMGEAMIEGLNRVLEDTRTNRGLTIKRAFFVFQQISEPMKFGGLSKISWKIHYTGSHNSTPIEIGITAKVGRDDYKRDLTIMLQQEICKLVLSEKWEKLINGEAI